MIHALMLLAAAAHSGDLKVTVARDSVSPDSEYEAPDLSPYTVEALSADAPTARDGSVSIERTEGNRFLEEAFRRERGEDLRRRQASDTTLLIVVDGGTVSLGQVVDQLDDPSVASRSEGVVTLRLPLLVKPGAGLVVLGEETPTLRLSTDRGAFLMNAGRLDVIDAEVVGWDEAAGVPSEFAKKTEFRPFLASLVRSRTNLAGSRFAHLGYAAPTAYGLSLSSHPDRAHGEPTDDSPSGVLVGNTFTGLYYGFYSFEARDVAIVDNTYDGCIVYGIDPHDRSTRLVIARNRAFGTRERHGIIGSRGISDSYVVGNVSYDNAGSGVMLDRQCRNNVVADNRVYNNGQGVAIYESPDNLIVGNVIASNAKSGVRVRNSVGCVVQGNTVVGNGDYAFEASARRLDDHEKRAARRDLYETRLEAWFHDNRLGGNRGVAKASGLGLLRLAGVKSAPTVAALGERLGVELNPVGYEGKDDEFGGDLKPHRETLRAAAEAGVHIEVRGR